MEDLLKLNPEYSQDAKIFKKIGRKVVFKDSKPLESSLSIISLPLFKILLRKSFYNSPELRKTYDEIIKRDSNDVERMIFKILCGKSVRFTSITLKFLFYREFPEQKSLFTDEKATKVFQIQDLLFRKIYFHEDTTESIERLISEASVLDQIFFLLALKPFIVSESITNLGFNLARELITAAGTNSSMLEYLPIILKGFRKKDLYTLVTSELLYSPLVEKMRVFTAVQDMINHETLSLCILNESWQTKGPIVKIYIVFLKIVEMLRLTYDFRVGLLYTWLRYFLYRDHLDLFYDLFENMKRVRGNTEEFGFYRAMYEYLKGGGEFERVVSATLNIKDSNRYSSITINQIVDKYNNESKGEENKAKDSQ